jgi:hypothetical protein
LTVTFAVPLVTVVIVALVFQYAFGADVITFAMAGAVPPLPVVPAAPVVPPRPPVPVVPAPPVVPPRPALPVVPAAPVVPALPVAPAVPVVLSTQALPEQCWVDVHACAQLPQFASLAVVSTHAVPHIVWPPMHMELHPLLLQTSFAWQAIVQLPQWVASDATQEPLQSSSPAWQPQIPLRQTWPPRQGMPQPPQFCESDIVSTHDEPQLCCVPGHGLPPVPAVPVVPAVPGDPVESPFVQAEARTARPSPIINARAVFMWPRFPAAPKVIVLQGVIRARVHLTFPIGPRISGADLSLLARADLERGCGRRRAASTCSIARFSG